MRNWPEFSQEAPELCDNGKRLLYQGDPIAAAFLATVTKSSSPRLHPIFPVVTDDGLWFFIVEMSPKYRDLIDNGKFALHSMTTDVGGEEFYITGNAIELVDEAIKSKVIAATEGRQGNMPFERLFECQLEHVLYTRWDNWNTESAWPNYEKWHA